MNEFIVLINYFPFVLGKDREIRVKTLLSKEEVEERMLQKNVDDYFEVEVLVLTIDEYFENMDTIEL